jgi:glycosyltransferase involved in cell wall biosynthesis
MTATLALVTPRYRPVIGGVETHVERLARNAVARGHHVEVLTQADGRSSPHEETLEGAVVRRFPIAYRSTHYAFSPQLWRYLRAKGDDYDVVHAHNYHSLPALAAALTLHDQTPFVFTPHYHGTSASAVRRALHRPYRLAGARILHKARAVICVSAREASLLSRDFPFVEKRVHVIPNGVDVEAVRSAVPFDENRTVILSIGRLEEYKQVDRIVAAMAHLDESFLLCVGGEGPARKSIEQQIQDAGLSHRVRLLGRVDDHELLRWFRTASVYVTASRIEAMPITPLEVMAAGGRVVASDIEAHREIAQVTKGPVTLFSPGASPAQIADEIRAAIAAPPRRAEVSTWEQVGDRTIEIYELAGRGQGRSPWAVDS